MKSKAQREAAAAVAQIGFLKAGTLNDTFQCLLDDAGPGWLVEYQEKGTEDSGCLPLDQALTTYAGSEGTFQLIEPLEVHNPHCEYTAGDRLSCEVEDVGDIQRWYVRPDSRGPYYFVPARSDCGCDGCRGLSRDPQWQFQKRSKVGRFRGVEKTISVWGSIEMTFVGAELSMVATSPDPGDFHFSGTEGQWTRLGLYEMKDGRYMGQKYERLKDYQGELKDHHSSVICDDKFEVFDFFGTNTLSDKLRAREIRRCDKKPSNLKDLIIDAGPAQGFNLHTDGSASLRFVGWLIGHVKCDPTVEDGVSELGVWQEVSGAYVCYRVTIQDGEAVGTYAICDLEGGVCRFFRRGGPADELYRKIGLGHVADYAGAIILSDYGPGGFLVRPI